MKKFITILFTVMLVFTFCSCEKTTDVSDISYTIDKNTVTIYGYIGTDPNLIIPEKIEGVKVAYIAEESFKDNSVVEYVKLPETIIEIGSDCFDNCESLKEVFIPSAVTKLGSVFDGCDMLEKVICPGVVEIDGTFIGLESLKEIKISDKLYKELKDEVPLYSSLASGNKHHELIVNGDTVTVPAQELTDW